MAYSRLKDKVNELMKDSGDKERLFDALRRYQSGQDLSRLLTDMQEILDEPNKLELFEHMRPLVLLHHQVAYSQLVPSAPGVKARIVRLRRRQNESLGFAVRGGLEHGVGVFVTNVKPGSQADKQGLMIGDEILGVNGFTISEAIHNDVLNLIKSRDDIVLKVTHIGMLPTKQEPTSDVKWKYIEKGAMETSEKDKQAKDLKIFVDSSGHHSLGCGILSGPPHMPGIFVERVRPGSVAEEVNLEPGDQLMAVNDTVFHRIGHKEAVLALVSSRQLNITLRKGVGLQLIKQIPDVLPTGNETNLATPPASLSSSSTDGTNSVHLANSNWSTTSHHGITTKENGENRKSPSSYMVTTQVEVHSDKSSSSSSSPSSSLSPAFSAALSWNESNNNSQTRTHSTGGSFLDMSGTSDSLRDQLRDEIKSRLGASPLSGAAAMMEQRKLRNSGPTTTPELLGCGEDFHYSDVVPNKSYYKFTAVEIDGRALHSLVYNKKLDLGVSIEGGLGSPLNGKILVAMVFDDGVAKKSGHMRVGDQLMSMNNKKLIDVTISKANSIIEDASASGSQDMVELIFCQSTLVNEEESMTYF